MRKISVVLFNLGGPDQPDSVRPFLFNLFSDKNIITAPQPIRFILAWFISKKREKEAREIYHHMGGKSPLLDHTEDQRRDLEDRLNAQDSDVMYKVFICMRYWHPMTSLVVRDVQDWGPDQILLLPLYPQFSMSTTGSSLEAWREESHKTGLTVQTRASCCYPLHPAFIQGHVDRLIRALDSATSKTDYPVRVLFSAHGLPKKFVQKGDPYVSQIEATSHEIEREIRQKRPDILFESLITFQSRVGPLEWTSPYTDKEIEKAGKEKRSLLICPVAFVSDHSETVVELGIEYRELAHESGVPAYDVVPVLGTHEDYIMCLQSEVIRLQQTQADISSHTDGRFCEKSWKKCPCIPSGVA